MANPRSTLRLAAILGLIAAILAWSAVAVRYFTDATINWSTARLGQSRSRWSVSIRYVATGRLSQHRPATACSHARDRAGPWHLLHR